MILSDALSKSSDQKSNKASHLLLKNVTISYKSGLSCIKLKYPDLKLFMEKVRGLNLTFIYFAHTDNPMMTVHSW